MSEARRRSRAGVDTEDIRRVRQRASPEDRESVAATRKCTFCQLPSCHSARHCAERDLYNFWLRCHAVRQEVMASSIMLPMDLQCVKMLTMLDRPSDLLAAREFAARYCADGVDLRPRSCRAFDALSEVMVFVFGHPPSFFERRDLLPKVDCFAPPIPEVEVRFFRFILDHLRITLQYSSGYHQRMLLRERLIANLELQKLPEGEVAPVDCPICLEVVPFHQCVQLANCKHVFCVRCFSSAVKSTACYRGCAMCRAAYGEIHVFDGDIEQLLIVDMSM